MRYSLIFLAMFWAAVLPADSADEMQHGVVCMEEGRFAGWPANNGIWSWGDEIVVGFTFGYYKESPTGGHDIDPDRGSERVQARSMDGGRTWTLERPVSAGADNAADAPATLRDPVDFTQPDLALRFSGQSLFYSLDRCHTWKGPFTLPSYGRPGLLCRTDYMVEGRDRVTAFVAAQKEGGGEGQPLCIRTTDGGRTWNLVGWIGKQPPEAYGYAIMPATVALPGDGYLSMIRRGGVFDGRKQWWLEAHVSPDDGKSWYLLDTPRIDNHGNPATLTRLNDTTLAMAYGWRAAPYGIRARVSKDNGQTWGPEIILRADAASWDIGYPRTVMRADGKCVTAYYFHPQGKDLRTIAATIWDPLAEYDE